MNTCDGSESLSKERLAVALAYSVMVLSSPIPIYCPASEEEEVSDCNVVSWCVEWVSTVPGSHVANVLTAECITWIGAACPSDAVMEIASSVGTVAIPNTVVQRAAAASGDCREKLVLDGFIFTGRSFGKRRSLWSVLSWSWFRGACRVNRLVVRLRQVPSSQGLWMMIWVGISTDVGPTSMERR